VLSSLEHRSGDYALLIRTDFSDDAAWNESVRLASAEYPAPRGYGGTFSAQFEVVNDETLAGLDAQAVAQRISRTGKEDASFVLYLADEQTMADPERTVRAVLLGDPDEQFRVAPGAFWMVENNLTIANADWEDFAASLDADGVYRGADIYA
jgi:hypothetical protein